MAEGKRVPETALNKMLVVTTEMILEHNRTVEAAKNSAAMIATPPAIDCDALYDLIQAAQKVYTENCPGP